ncbi:50S ribosomal protein L4 [Candidatus Kaiserbacteria bacterium]|nr:50S ribosomal protein L4 [Candidatus Kaiserbacteria bacterium]
METKIKTEEKRTRAPKARVEKAAASVLAEAQVYSMKGDKVSTIALPEKIFAAPWRSDLVHQVVTAMQANARQNRAHTKDRSEVSGGGRKPWRQKGTGQARHSSTRSPIWRHGGITFGPRKERDYSEKINKKMKFGALAAVLSKKAKDGEIVLVDGLSFAAPKTKEALAALVALSKSAKAKLLSENGSKSVLIVLHAYNTNVIKSFRNLHGVATEEARSLNPLALLSHKYVVIEKPEAAFAALLSRAETK